LRCVSVMCGMSISEALEIVLEEAGERRELLVVQ
jgi:hypothetical protein